jgi:serine/threonine-protein kinase
MSTDSIYTLLDQLLDYQLLKREHVNELARQSPDRFEDSRALAKYLVQQGWLTVYQVNQLLQGQGHDLVLGPYHILDRLGEGAISQVFKARHTSNDGVVALKVLRPNLGGHTDAVRQFEREIWVVSRLSHPNIVKVIEAGQVGGVTFFTMEYVEGTDLGKFANLAGYLPVVQACEFIRQTALGLQHAHERGLVHRDIKPANLFLTSGPSAAGLRGHPGCGSGPPAAASQVKILDWGLARLHQSSGQPESSGAWIQPGTLIGTADYLAPEQAKNAHNVDIRADIYSLGCTFYYLLTRRPPFPGSSLMQKLLNHEQAEPTPVQELRPDLPDALPPVLQKMMAKRPEDRHQIPLRVAVALTPFCAPSRPPSSLLRRPALDRIAT